MERIVQPGPGPEEERGEWRRENCSMQERACVRAYIDMPVSVTSLPSLLFTPSSLVS